MTSESVHTVVLGAGPAGLAAAYTLAKAGCTPVVVEKGKVPGGLMRSIKRGEFILDIGRKELYTRLPKVDALWSELLGPEFRKYPHRGGILFEGQIIDISPFFRGFRRGMPFPMLFGCAWDLVRSRFANSGERARTLEQYFYQRRGKKLSQVISQGFQEKLSGVKWSDVPMPENFKEGQDSSLFSTVKGLLTRTMAKKEVNTAEGVWKHPAKGTGQICDTLAEEIVKHGGRFIFDADIKDIESADGCIRAITVQSGDQTTRFETRNLVSSIPVQFLLKQLLKEKFDSLDQHLKAPPSSKKTIVLVYLFLNEEPRFPHAWLNVTCQQTRIGRITNYSAISDAMVPKGKTCLCCEYYCFEGDPLLSLDNKAFAQRALKECADSGLLDPSKLFDELVLRLPGADASQNRHNWMSSMREGLLEILKPYRNLYYVSRTDLDIATLAGVESAEAILADNRETFDRHIDPTELDIRGGKKAFEFRNPTEQGI